MIVSGQQQQLYTVREIADFYRVSTQAVYRWVAQGKLAAVRIGGNIRIEGNELNRVITR